MSLGNLPSDTPDLTFKAVQTYDNGDVVRWIDEAAPGAPEPQHPAPVLHLTPAAANSTAASATTAGTSGPTTAALILAIVGVVLALIAAVLAGPALRRRTGSTDRGAV